MSRKLALLAVAALAVGVIVGYFVLPRRIEVSSRFDPDLRV